MAKLVDIYIVFKRKYKNAFLLSKSRPDPAWPSGH